MIEDKIMPIENSEDLCWKCLQHKEHIHKFMFGDLGYGSSFDCFGSQIQLCDVCLKESNPEIWEFEEIDANNEYGGHYKYEDKMWEYIEDLPIQSKELFYNRTCFGCNADYLMQPQDWIDYALDLLPHEKCKEYNRYSPEERKAYAERFPICNKVKRYVYPDGSSGCSCVNNAFGNNDGSCGLNVSENCYKCNDFKKRRSTIKTIIISEESLTKEYGNIMDAWREMRNYVEEIRNLLK